MDIHLPGLHAGHARRGHPLFRAEGVAVVQDGQQEEKRLWPMQMPEVIELLRGFYAEYCIRYATPVYGLPRTDRELYARGLTESPDVKFRTLQAGSAGAGEGRGGPIAAGQLRRRGHPKHFDADVCSPRAGL